MVENGQFRRLESEGHIRGLVQNELATMTTIVEHRRSSSTGHEGVTMSTNERKLIGCVEVQLWAEADGSECVVVMGNDAVSRTELKGLMHDGIYALAHNGEPGFAPVAPHQTADIAQI